ncbi:MAG: carboxyl transferase domain-containing protein, partial [Mycobacterium sp.]
MTTKTTAELLSELHEKLELAKEPGGEKAVAKREKKGIPSARSRIHALLDPGSFLETGMFSRHQSHYFGLADADLPADGVVTGEGAVRGR